MGLHSSEETSDEAAPMLGFPGDAGLFRPSVAHDLNDRSLIDVGAMRNQAYSPGERRHFRNRDQLRRPARYEL